MEKKRANLVGVNTEMKKEAAKKKQPPKATEQEEKPKTALQNELDDEILNEEESKGSSRKWLFIVCAVAVVVMVVFVVILMLGKKESPSVPEPEVQQPVVEQPSKETPVPELNNDFGTQDFTKDTNMQTSSVLNDPEEFVEDIYGLSTRVDYTVSKISSAADFVSYEKKRGTWGGGLELYWLDAVYKGKQYSIQIPFEYYKELDEVGIVPVKMEVVTVPGSADGEFLTIITYMQLDADTLKTILKSQKK